MRHAKAAPQAQPRLAPTGGRCCATSAASVIEHERIRTSQAKAKAVKPEVEKLITLAKRGDLHARRQALSELGQDKFLVHKLFEEVAPALRRAPRRLHADRQARPAPVGLDRDGLPRAGLSRRGQARAVPTARLKIAYDGSRFAGWSAQPGQRTVQGELEVGARADPRRAGRADGRRAHRRRRPRDRPGGELRARGELPDGLAERLNAVLPHDVAVLEAEPAPDGFDARRSATAADLPLPGARLDRPRPVRGAPGAVVALPARPGAARRARRGRRRHPRLHRLHPDPDRARAVRAQRRRSASGATSARSCWRSRSRRSRSCATRSACWSGRCSRSAAAGARSRTSSALLEGAPRDGAGETAPAARALPGRRALLTAERGVGRRVAVVDRERVAVRVLEEGLVADARVDRLALELDPARLELGLGGLEVSTWNSIGKPCGLNSIPKASVLHHGDRQVAGLELARAACCPSASRTRARASRRRTSPRRRSRAVVGTQMKSVPLISDRPVGHVSSRGSTSVGPSTQARTWSPGCQAGKPSGASGRLPGAQAQLDELVVAEEAPADDLGARRRPRGR